jgi:hypothetical protein
LASTASVTLSSNAYYPRKAIIYMAVDGSITVSLGTASSEIPSGNSGRQTEYPLVPYIPSDSVFLSEVWIPASAVIGNNLILYNANQISTTSGGASVYRGIATISEGQLNAIITHGWGSAPETNSIILTPVSSSLGRAYFISDCNASTFKINMSTRDTIDHKFSWELIT